MKKLIALTVALIALLTISTACAGDIHPDYTLQIDHVYPSTMIIIEVNYYEDIVTMVDGGGHIWIMEGVEDYNVYDLVSVMMCDNYTEYVTDDVIMTAFYAGAGNAAVAMRWMGY